MKVGDYVRFKTLCREIKIGKVIEIIAPDKNSMKKYCVYDLDNNEATVDDYVIKSSSDLFEILEIGDYVNGMEVMDADWINEDGEYEEGLAFPMYASDDLDIIENWLPLKNVKIKSIVTKEQFESMKYIVGSDKE